LQAGANLTTFLVVVALAVHVGTYCPEARRNLGDVDQSAAAQSSTTAAAADGGDGNRMC
jgi:hypothetical protein